MKSRVVNYSGRTFFVQFIFIIFFILLLVRLIYIQVFEDEFIKKQIDSRIALENHILAKRGKILDRNNRLLAVDVTGYTVIADLSSFSPNKDQISILNSLLELSPKKTDKILIKSLFRMLF